MNHVDLAAGGQGSTMWSSGLVESLEDYDAPAICHYGCEAAPPRPPKDLGVPWRDVILVFKGTNGTSETPAGGWAVKANIDNAVELPPTYIALAADGKGSLTLRSAPGALDGGGTLIVVVPHGKVTLAIDASGMVSMLGGNEAIVELLVAGGITVFGDGAAVRAYPGAPDAVLAATVGSCSQPFHVDRVGADEVLFAPADACEGDLWIAPIASRSRDVDVATFLSQGQGAIVSSAFVPTMLAPVRAPTILTTNKDGHYKRARAPSGSAADEAAKLGYGLYGTVPLLSAPLAETPAGSASEPIFVYHQSKEGDGGYPPTSPPSDVAWIDQDTPDEVCEMYCSSVNATGRVEGYAG
jgi:hypothetical protein